MRFFICFVVCSIASLCSLNVFGQEKCFKPKLLLIYPLEKVEDNKTIMVQKEMNGLKPNMKIVSDDIIAGITYLQCIIENKEIVESEIKDVKDRLQKLFSLYLNELNLYVDSLSFQWEPSKNVDGFGGTSRISEGNVNPMRGGGGCCLTPGFYFNPLKLR